MKIKSKILLLSLFGTLTTVIVIVGVVLASRNKLDQRILAEADKTARSQLTAMGKSLRELLSTQNTLTSQQVNMATEFAGRLLREMGGIETSTQTVEWAAVNQFSHEESIVQLPQFVVDGEAIEQNDDPGQPTPFVDGIAASSGGTCTIFQRMNDEGDMLRVATTVMRTNGRRAVGTYIPATNPSGDRNTVVATLLRGETYYGRAFVVNKWYTTAYEPVFDHERRVIGAVYVGMLQEEAASLAKRIRDIQIGESGHAFVLGGHGDARGRFIISGDGERDGELALEDTDSEGHKYVETMIQEATAESSIVLHQYSLPGEQNSEPQQMVAALFYYEPWDWVVGVTADMNEYYVAAESTRSALNGLLRSVCISASVLVIVVWVVSSISSKMISRPLVEVTETLQHIAQGDGDLTLRLKLSSSDETGELARWFNLFMDRLQDIIRQVAETASELNDKSDGLLQSASELSQSVERTTGRSSDATTASEEMSHSITAMTNSSNEMSSSLNSIRDAVEQMTSSIGDIASNATFASEIASEATTVSEQSSQTLANLGTAANEIGKVISVIQEIAEQTNLLALNATIEAARAGQFGKGFAVVAGEVKELARQTADATEKVAASVGRIQGSSKDAIESLNQISTVIEKMKSTSVVIASAVENQNATTQSIAANLGETADTATTMSVTLRDNANASQAVSASIQDVDLAANDTALTATAIRESGNDLSRIAGQIRQLSSGFKV